MILERFEGFMLLRISILPQAGEYSPDWKKYLVRAAELRLDDDDFYAADLSGTIDGDKNGINVLIRVTDYKMWDTVSQEFKCRITGTDTVEPGLYGQKACPVEILETKNGDLIWSVCMG